MIRRLLCWLGDLLGKDWHKWVSRTEIKPFDIMLSH